MINFDDLAEDIVDSCIPGPFVITKIVCDHTNNSEEDSKNNVINVDIFGYRIVPATEITINFIAKPTQE